jgi:hypothetical protein
VPLAPRLLGGAGITLRGAGATLAVRARGIGPRPANETDTLSADGYLVLGRVASYALGPWRLGLTVDNLLDAAWREAQVAETSRLPNEAAPVEDIHVTPGAPLTAPVTVGFVLR